MASQDDGLAATADSRERKRQRDKQNQREKRKREQDSVDELKNRNDSLERRVKILQAGSDDAVKQLSETVEQLRARNEVLVKKLSRVSAFVKAWTEEDLGDAQTDGTGHDESSIQSRNFVAVNNDPPPSGSSSNHVRPLMSPTIVSPSTDAGNKSESHDGLTTRSNHLTATEISTAEPLVFPMPKLSAADGYSMSNAGSSRTSSIDRRSFVAPSRTQEGGFDLTVPIGKVQATVNLPVWKRLPSLSNVAGPRDILSSIIHDWAKDPKRSKFYIEKPEALHLTLGRSDNELANSVCYFTAQMPTWAAERFAFNWMCYIFSRWLILPSEKSFNSIPKFLKPTLDQIFIAHPLVVDYVLWPQIRDNFIKSGTKYCLPEVFDLLFNSYRLRDPVPPLFDRGVVKPLTDPTFLERIYEIDEWALLETFWTRYPELVKGLDPIKFMVSG